MESNSCKGLVSALTYPLHVSRPENGRWQHSAPGHSLECVLADERPLLPTSKRAGLDTGFPSQTQGSSQSVSSGRGRSARHHRSLLIAAARPSAPPLRCWSPSFRGVMSFVAQRPITESNRPPSYQASTGEPESNRHFLCWWPEVIPALRGWYAVLAPANAISCG